MTNLLKNKINNDETTVILYELIPPIHATNPQNIKSYIDCAIDLFQSSSIPIDALNIPEIREETHRNSQVTRTECFAPKINTVLFAELLREMSPHQMDVILNHCTVYEDWQDQFRWLKDSVEEHHIKNLILIGGESSKIHYPGPSVVEMSEYIQKKYKSTVCCGGITIPTRRNENELFDEPYRLLNKIKSGLEFFTSQIIYEVDSMTQLLEDYYYVCQQHQLEPKRIFLSFAPISTEKDLNFLRWLGVKIPDDVAEKLFSTDIGTGWRSVKIAVNILQTILTFMIENKIRVPIGLTIEHINKHNFELTKEFIEQLGKVYVKEYSVLMAKQPQLF